MLKLSWNAPKRHSGTSGYAVAFHLDTARLTTSRRLQIYGLYIYN